MGANFGIKSDLQAILSKKMEVFEEMEGCMQLKNVRFDLGQFTASEYDRVYRARLEAVCDDFVKQLLKACQKKKNEQLSNIEVLAFNRSIYGQKLTIETEEVQRLEKLIHQLEQSGTALNFERIYKRYQSEFASKMPTVSKNIVQRLIQQGIGASEIGVNKRGAFTDDGDTITTQLSKLLLLLKSENYGAYWVDKLLKDYAATYGESVHKQVRNKLYEVQKTQQELPVQRSPQIDALQNPQKGSKKGRLLAFLEHHVQKKDSEQLSFLIQKSIPQDVLPSNWFEFILKAYQIAHVEVLPLSMQQLLLQFIKSEGHLAMPASQYKKQVQGASSSNTTWQSERLPEVSAVELKSRMQAGLHSAAMKQAVNQTVVDNTLEVVNAIGMLGTNWLQRLEAAYLQAFEVQMPTAMLAILKQFEAEMGQGSIPKRDLMAKRNTVQSNEFAWQTRLVAKIRTAIKDAKGSQVVLENIRHLFRKVPFARSPLLAELQKAYVHAFGEELPKEVQQLIAQFDTEEMRGQPLKTKEVIKQPSESLEFKLQRILETKIRTAKASANALHKVQENVFHLLGNLKSSEANWLEKLEATYVQKYDVTLPEKMRGILNELNIGELYTSPLKKNKELRNTSESLRLQLQKALRDTLEKITESSLILQMAQENIMRLLRDTNLRTANWLQVLQKQYAHEFDAEIPKEILRFLLEFNTELLRDQWREKGETSDGAARASMSVERPTVMKSTPENPQGLLRSTRVKMNVLDVLEALDLGAVDWLRKFTESYAIQFGSSLPKAMKQILEKTGTTVKQTYTSSTISRLLLAYLGASKIKAHTAALTAVLNERKPRLSIDHWYATIQEEYRLCYGQEVPLVHQQQLETFSKTTLKNSMAKAFKNACIPQFNMKLPKDTIPFEAAEKAKNYQEKTAPTKVSEQAKLLKLKETLKAMKEKRSAQEFVIVENAGIICGWVLWKKWFDKFDWLRDGQFFIKKGQHTAVMAASWLQRLGRGDANSVNPLFATICDIDADSSVVYSDEALQEAMGAFNLEDSIRQYYEELLAMWPIFSLEDTSIFIDLFLQREGVLSTTSIGWELVMVKAPYDQLMQQTPIPWPLSYIRFSWTTNTIGNVTW